MAIRILPEDEIKQAANSFQNPALLFANPTNLYERRAKRLRDLAKDHPFADYLNFAAKMADAQLVALTENPLEKQDMVFEDTYPLDAKNWQRHTKWREYLTALLAELKPTATAQIQATIDWLEKASSDELEQLADNLLQQDFAHVESDKAVFIWAALSVYWLQLAHQLPRGTQTENAEGLHYCPVCHSAPVASVIQFGSSQGLRYLHCSLCETEWNMVRAQCSNCGHSKELDYWAIDNDNAPIKAESCGECHSYLKVVYQEKDPYVEPVADDLASLFLDIEMEEKDFSRSGLNPFMFPSE